MIMHGLANFKEVKIFDLLAQYSLPEVFIFLRLLLLLLLLTAM